ncbi:MAG: SRPBCC family protein [Actinomycetota bacterium]
MSAADADTGGDERIVAVSRVIAAEPSIIFDLLADPARHHEIDGSDTVVAANDKNPDRLTLGARFGMSMRFGLPYRMTSEVVEFVEDEVIAWRHLGHHVWRYRLTPVEGGTEVTESFNWGVARFPPMYEWVGYPERHRRNMTRTLERLEAVVTAD